MECDVVVGGGGGRESDSGTARSKEDLALCLGKAFRAWLTCIVAPSRLIQLLLSALEFAEAENAVFECRSPFSLVIRSSLYYIVSRRQKWSNESPSSDHYGDLVNDELKVRFYKARPV